MRDFPQELLIPLLFAVFLLVQFLYKQLRNRALATQAHDVPQTEPHAAAVLEPTPAPAQAEPPRVRRIIKDFGAMVPASTAPASPPPRRHIGRFSRPGLMPDRRAIQSAIVISAILRPCHAHRPHQVE